ncbi:hypothetical protein DY000_02034449 [Brassica cretica]|uniref:Protein EARLY FLOWERING 3 n=1 Tax=Brassica cretica TaxID=69181 RepID=A0ABQ7DRL4_BRACR|nr:hypothetical protein DY000_02034449 [Brassica cretica]
MKREKEEEEKKKKLEPMFPRLHVNDADKGGGPRAPPRNKMALYEHLTTPSHRFTDHSSSPRHTNTLFPPPPGPSNQPCGVERNLTSQHLDSSASGHVTQMSSMENVTTLAHRRRDQRKTLREEDGFAVPVYDNDSSRRFQCPLEKSASGCERVNASLLRQESTSSRLDHETGVMEIDDGVESHGSPNDVDDDDDSISSVDVSPDEVVGVLGQKRFWRARKAIANQQRIFAVQLFELHRLIKVQRLIASSSDVLLDEISYLGNVPVKKLLPSEFIVKPPPLPQVTKHRRCDSEKTDQDKMECSAENVVGKSSNQGQQHQPSNYMPFASNPPAANGCYYPPPSGGNQQWLIPVMSPSEGLIYKPHPGPGHTRPPICGGYYGHFMPAPMIMGSFMDGGPPPFHPGVGNGYFPPYGMMNTYGSGHQQQQQPNEQMNQFVHPGNLQYASAVNSQQQSSVNEAISQQQPTKSYQRARKSRRRSTGSSPSGQEGISGTNSFRPLSVVDDDDDDNNEPEQMMTTTTTTTRTTVTQTTRDGGGVTRVIKVVPHNAKLASENAARIFRSIQEERKHYDSFSNHF